MGDSTHLGRQPRGGAAAGTIEVIVSSAPITKSAPVVPVATSGGAASGWPARGHGKLLKSCQEVIIVIAMLRSPLPPGGRGLG